MKTSLIDRDNALSACTNEVKDDLITILRSLLIKTDFQISFQHSCLLVSIYSTASLKHFA